MSAAISRPRREGGSSIGTAASNLGKRAAIAGAATAGSGSRMRTNSDSSSRMRGGNGTTTRRASSATRIAAPTLPTLTEPTSPSTRPAASTRNRSAPRLPSSIRTDGFATSTATASRGVPSQKTRGCPANAARASSDSTSGDADALRSARISQIRSSSGRSQVGRE